MLHIYRRAEALERLNSLKIAQPAEDNIFNHPAFLQPALQYFGSSTCGLISIENQQTKFLMPFQVARAGLGFARTIYGWSNVYSTQGTPLIAEHTVSETLTSVLNGLSQPQNKLPDTLLLPDINLDGAFAKALLAYAKQHNLPLQIIRQEARPVLLSGKEHELYLTNAIGKNHHRDYRRLWRRLSETGTLEYQIATDKIAIFKALEAFLKLEASGWKGKRGTAFLNKPQHTDFIRIAVSNLAEQERVDIHSLALNGKTIASLIIFTAGDQAWTWKTAYDETLRAFSPGVLLMIEFLKNQLGKPEIRITDSCAIPDHPVMSRLFHQRQSFGTIILGLTDQSQQSVHKISSQLQRYDRLRNTIRSLKARLKAQ